MYYYYNEKRPILLVFQASKMNKLPQLKASPLCESGDGLGFGEVGVMAGQPTPSTYPPPEIRFIKALLRESNGFS